MMSEMKVTSMLCRSRVVISWLVEVEDRFEDVGDEGDVNVV